MSGRSQQRKILTLEAKLASVKRQRNYLALPFVILTFPISVPILALFAALRARKKKRKGRPPLTAHNSQVVVVDHRHWTRGAQESAAPVLPLLDKSSVADEVLIWCPIATAGLTTQLEQLAEILRYLGVRYRVSYHREPDIAHPETINWIRPDQVRKPRVVFFMERYVPFETGFLDSYHVFYVNLDWLAPKYRSLARVYADLVLVPTPYRLEDIESQFPNSVVKLLPWPPATALEAPSGPSAPDAPIRVLYVGNDYNDRSRKSPYEVVAAILSCSREDLRFDLKFRTSLPKDVRRQLEACPNVDRIIDYPVSARRMEQLYRDADVNLAPNCSEGNGLSILEAFAKGVVPAVLDGHPMKEVVSPEAGYLIACDQVGDKEYAPLYRTSTKAISAFLGSLSRVGIAARQDAIARKQNELAQRQVELEATVRTVLALNGLISPPDRSDAGTPPAEADLSPLARTPWHTPYLKPARLIDIFLTTSRRASQFEQSLTAVLSAMEASPYDHRLTVFADGLDPATETLISAHRDRLFQVTWTREAAGLPYAWNLIVDTSANMAARSERVADYICYIQDDCLITRADAYFEAMVTVAEAFEPAQLGFVSGYFTEVHPGFAETRVGENRVILSDSIDGKNFMARPKTLYSIGKLTWWFGDGQRRGNPGPCRGSHFDLWQWRDSPRSLGVQGRVSAILPDLCLHTAETAEASTWKNNTGREAVKMREADGRIYQTRPHWVDLPSGKGP